MNSCWHIARLRIEDDTLTRISFYALSNGQNDPLSFACRLTEKVLRTAKHVYLHADNEAQAAKLDELLWTQTQGSFIPHELWTGQPDTEALPVLIGTEAPPEHRHDILINLAAEAPPFFSSFERLLEIVEADNPTPGRQRYLYYKDRGYPLETHKI